MIEFETEEDGMTPIVRSYHRYLVCFQRGPHFGIEEIPSRTKEEAIALAIGCHFEDANWVEVKRRIDNKVIVTREQTKLAYDAEMKRLGIKEIKFSVSISYSAERGFGSTLEKVG